MAISHFRTLAAVLLSSVLATVLLLAGGLSAQAHSGPYELSINTDGAGGVSVSGKYAADGHIVEALMDVVVTAKSKDGKSVGPIELKSSAEGRGIWISAEPFMSDGEWTVTAATTTPQKVTAETSFVVAPLATPVAPEPLNDSANGADAAPSSSLDVWLWGLGGFVVAAGGGTAFYVLQRRRAVKA